ERHLPRRGLVPVFRLRHLLGRQHETLGDALHVDAKGVGDGGALGERGYGEPEDEEQAHVAKQATEIALINRIVVLVQSMWHPTVADDRPAYLGIADAIGDAIVAGRLTGGEQLPTVRAL